MNAKLKSSNPRILANRQGLWLKVGDSKLQPETCSLPLRGPSTRQRYLPALCSSVMAFAPSSTQGMSSRVLRSCTGVLQAVRQGDIDTLEVVEAEDIGSTPVLKIALPSSPLPSDRYASRS